MGCRVEAGVGNIGENVFEGDIWSLNFEAGRCTESSFVEKRNIGPLQKKYRR